jgi:VanZ family protein
VPPSHRPVTDASHSMEHFGIFLATGFAFGFGYPSRPLALALALATLCGVIEVAQHWIPGRHARLSDFLVDAAATIIGVGIAYMGARGLPMQKIGTRS